MGVTATVAAMPSLGTTVQSAPSLVAQLSPGGGDKNYLFRQSTPSDTWTIHHGLGKYPAVSVMDSAGSLVVGAVEYVDENTVTISFNGAFSGTATLN